MDAPSQAPVIPVGNQNWQWSPDEPLGGSRAWARSVGWLWRLPEHKTTRVVHVRLASDPGERALRRAAKRACREARRGLLGSGGVKAHGEAHAQGAALALTLHVEVHSLRDEPANREACLDAFEAAFRRALA